LSEAVAGERRRTSDREGPTTESAEPVINIWQAELTFIRFFQISKKIILDIRKEYVISEILAH